MLRCTLRQSGLVRAVCTAALLAAGPVSAQVTFEWVTVGGVGNAPDPTTGFGSVGYEYRVALHEVTNAQYAAFLNAVAASDPNALYNTDMGSNSRGGITRSGSDGSYTYAVKPDMGNKPVNYTSWYDAARFCNWMTNGQGLGGGTGSTESGVYTLNGPTSVEAITRNLSDSAQVFLPTEDEWYKAAYHQPAAQGGDLDDYWQYATQTNALPSLAGASSNGDVSNPGPNVVNYDFGADWGGRDGNVTTVGTAGNTCFYGAYDMSGNVFEWNETLVADDARGLRGGAWNRGEGGMRASNRGNDEPIREDNFSGFRVASPAPPQCPADLTGEGDVNTNDFFLFLSLYQAMDPRADFAPGGGINTNDFFAFLAAYQAGC